MTTDQRFAAVGSWVLVLWGMGHAITIDILPLVFGIYLHDVDPAVFDHMRDSVFRFPYTGQSTAYFLFYGLSIWQAVSLVGFGVLNLILARSPGEIRTRRMIYAVDIVLAASFLTIGAICYFAIPIIGGVIALIFFCLAMLACIRTSPREDKRSEVFS